MVCMCSLVCVYGWADTCENASVGPKLILDIFPWLYITSFIEARSLTESRTTSFSLPSLGIRCLYFMSTGIPGGCQVCLTFMRVALTHMKQVVYPQTHLSSPNLFIYLFIIMFSFARDVAQLVEYLSSLQEALSFIFSTAKTQCPWEVEAKGSEVSGHPQVTWWVWGQTGLCGSMSLKPAKENLSSKWTENKKISLKIPNNNIYPLFLCRTYFDRQMRCVGFFLYSDTFLY